MLPHRPWVPEIYETRITDITTRTAAQSPAQITTRLQALAKQNREIHEQEFFNLKPATNLMSPRAEAMLSSGIGSRP
jgi:glycine hydroxymethyltransferase